MDDFESTGAGAEVAEDFRSALDDMKSVARLEIVNLCQIARENTEFAIDISETLQSFILEAAPHRKLPALYVLDAIVKNVGTPYTLYLAPRLYKMFMESYATVDSGVRRKMEEMLRTWKQPVPGSLDTRPVFPLDVVNPIENALMKASTSAMQAQHKLSASRPRNMRPSPAPVDRGFPPNGAQFPGQPTPQTQPQQGVQMRRTVSRDMGSGPSYPPTGTPGPQSLPVHIPPSIPEKPSVDLGKLKQDVDSLIRNLQTAGAHYPHDESIGIKTKALKDLQDLLNVGADLTPDQLVLIKQQVDDLTKSTDASFGHLFAPAPPPAAPRVTLDSLLGAGAMAALLKRQTPTPTPSIQSNGSSAYTPPAVRPPPSAPTGPSAMRPHNMGIPQALPIVPVMSSATPPASLPRKPTGLPSIPSIPSAPAAAPSVNEAMGLMAQLRKAGMLTNTSQNTTPLHTPTPASSYPPPMPQAHNMPVLPPIIANALAAQRNKRPQQWKPPHVEKDEITFDVESLKADRSHLLPTMLDNLGKPCLQCGRRFTNDEMGRKRRVAHMDWHFNVHQRSLKAESRGQHRSWYLDGKAWVESREELDAETVENAPSKSEETQAPQVQYIPVPDPADIVNTSCSICADRFVNKWLDSAQEWVWMDTIRVGNKAYHASCYGEAYRSKSPPEPVLGKRKAESPVSGGLAMLEGKKWRAEAA